MPAMSTLPALATTLLAKPSLEGLSFALRHPEVWPEVYAKDGWHFPECSRCAMGLANELWGAENWWYLAEFCDFRAATSAFVQHGHPFVRYDAVQPHHVADAIDAYLAARAEAA